MTTELFFQHVPLHFCADLTQSQVGTHTYMFAIPFTSVTNPWENSPNDENFILVYGFRSLPASSIALGLRLEEHHDGDGVMGKAAHLRGRERGQGKMKTKYHLQRHAHSDIFTLSSTTNGPSPMNSSKDWFTHEIRALMTQWSFDNVTNLRASVQQLNFWLTHS